jgi:hypothetical protein
MFVHIISFSLEFWKTTLILLATTLILPAVLFFTMRGRLKRIMKIYRLSSPNLIYLCAWLWSFSWWFSICLVDMIDPELYFSTFDLVGTGALTAMIFQICGDFVFILLVYVLSKKQSQEKKSCRC